MEQLSTTIPDFVDDFLSSQAKQNFVSKAAVARQILARAASGNAPSITAEEKKIEGDHE